MQCCRGVPSPSPTKQPGYQQQPFLRYYGTATAKIWTPTAGAYIYRTCIFGPGSANIQALNLFQIPLGSWPTTPGTFIIRYSAELPQKGGARLYITSCLQSLLPNGRTFHIMHMLPRPNNHGDNHKIRPNFTTKEVHFLSNFKTAKAISFHFTMFFLDTVHAFIVWTRLTI